MPAGVCRGGLARTIRVAFSAAFPRTRSPSRKAAVVKRWGTRCPFEPPVRKVPGPLMPRPVPRRPSAASPLHHSEPLAEADRELDAGGVSESRRIAPLGLHVAQPWERELLGGAVAGEVAVGLDGAPNRGIEALDCVGGVHRPPDRLGEREERHDPIPRRAPAPGDGRVLPAPRSGLEVVQRGLGRVRGRRPVEVLSAADIALRSFRAACASERRIGCTRQVCTTASGNTAPMASGNPLRPSTTTSGASARPYSSSTCAAMSRVVVPRAYIEITLSSKPGSRQTPRPPRPAARR